MVMPNASIAPGLAMEVAMINYNAIFRYKTAMALLRKVLKQGVISSDDFGLISIALAKKHGLSPYSIFLEKPCYLRESEGCIVAKGGRPWGGKQSN